MRKSSLSASNAILIADKRARVYRIINDTRSPEVPMRRKERKRQLMNDFRVNP